jgi:hypothetical protein
MSDKKALLQAIAKEEAILSRLDSEREQALLRLNTFKQQLGELETACTETPIKYAIRTPQEKVALFRSLFRGGRTSSRNYGRAEPVRRVTLLPAQMIGFPAAVEKRVNLRSSAASAMTTGSFL